MKATQNQQQDLLHLYTLETEIERKRAAIQAIIEDPELSALRESQRTQATEVITAHNAVEAIELELSRSESDLLLVTQRIQLDRDRLGNTASAKDAQGIQSELESLGKRQSELEDVSLIIMDRLEVASKELEALAQKDIVKLKSGGELLLQEHGALKARIDPEHLAHYLKLAKRGVPIGRLEGRECGACRMALGASSFTALASLDADEFATCPECQALLVR
jgi:predicted  nucleic acid-binding Zn-ribbon protein